MVSSLSSFTKEELQKKLKTQKIIFLTQFFVVFLMIILAKFSSIEKGISFQTFLPLFFFPMCLVMFFEVKKIKKELTLRN